MKIIKKLTPYNFTSRNDTSRIKYIVIHYFGGTCTAADLAAGWAKKYVGASAHYAVGHSGDVYQMVQDEDIAWHCGANTYVHKECRNTNSIGIEMAVRKKNTKTLYATDKDWYFEPATVESTVELTKGIMRKYNIPASRVIRHTDVTGKICPNPYVYNNMVHTWKKFKAAIAANSDTKEDNIEPDVLMVKTTCDVLRIRAGAGVNFQEVGRISESEGKKNVYTIVEERSGWGCLKSGIGWICLDYTKKIS